ncbi:alpha-parvin isoform X1 [Octopus sinensis]|uniref:Alpha-parvin isoform X1 n=1 Tax=Octopus sinensis TaxID=2607531 RepID=A0A6P7S5G8_9MOLL|nr:alpha-parvin isoform X1 [Octopus sinensis]
MAHTNPTPTKKKEESFFDKIGTLTSKKKTKEVNELVQEGKDAIECRSNLSNLTIDPEGYKLEENEERSMVDPSSREDYKVKELMNILLGWINDELADQRIIVKDVEEDLFDGQILQKLIEKLANIKIQVPEVTQSEIGQKHKLRIVLDVLNNEIFQIDPANHDELHWSVDSIHSKNLAAILHLLVALARFFHAPIRLPDNVAVTVLVVQKCGKALNTRKVKVEITSSHEELLDDGDMGARIGHVRDAFDTLLDHAPEKLNLVKKTLISFVNKHLIKVNLEVTDLEKQFHDGFYLILLMGLLEGYFVSLGSIHQTATTFEEKVHNVQFAFELMQDAGLQKPSARVEDIVNCDLIATLRVLYDIFTKYKSVASTSS